MRGTLAGRVTAAVIVSLFAAMPGGAAADTSVRVPGAFKTETVTSEDGSRCNAYLTYVWGHIPGAENYRVQATDTVTGSYDDTVEPGFDAGLADGLPPVGKNRQRTRMNASFGPAPCPSDLNNGRWTVEVSANFDEKPRIVGTVSDTDGNPVGGVKVSMDGPSRTSATTNSGGGYGKQVKAGRYTVSAGKGYCVAGGGKCKESKSVSVKSGEVGAVDFVASDETVTLSGGVLEEACADSQCTEVEVRPAAGRTVTALGRSDTVPYTVVTDERGNYEMEVPVGIYDVAVERTDPREDFYPESRRVDAQQDVRHLDFKICGLFLDGRKCGPLVDLTGKVVDADGKGYGGATVRAAGDVAVTFSTGRFKLQVPKGRVRVNAVGEIGLAKSPAYEVNATEKRNEMPRPVEIEPELVMAGVDTSAISVSMDGLPRGRHGLEFSIETSSAQADCLAPSRDVRSFRAGEGQGSAQRAAFVTVTPSSFGSQSAAFCSGIGSVKLKKFPRVAREFEVNPPEG